MQGLTKRQEKILNFITSSIAERGYPPTLREIGKHMGISSTNGVNDHLRALEKKGYLKREDMKSRALRPVNMAPANAETIKIPLIGRVVPGVPLFTESHIEDRIAVDRVLVGNLNEPFAIRVNGDAMKDAGILDGDILLVKRQMAAQDGDIVVALLGDSPAVRYYRSDGEHLVFTAANKDWTPILIKRSDFQPMQLLGVAVGLYRRL